jgi:hypothetical protein
MHYYSQTQLNQINLSSQKLEQQFVELYLKMEYVWLLIQEQHLAALLLTKIVLNFITWPQIFIVQVLVQQQIVTMSLR